MQITEKDFIVVKFSEVIAKHFGSMQPQQYLELSEQIYEAMLEYARQTSSLNKK